MQSLPQIHLVDIHGHDVASWEKATDPEPDPTDAANWPAWTDNWHWCVDPHDVASLEAAECERLADLHDAPHPGYGEQVWAQLIIEGSLPAISGGSPEPYQPTAEDWADYREWTTTVERLDAERMEQDARNPLYGYE